MPNADFRFGLTNGPDLHVCSADGVQDKKLDLDAGGVFRLGGVSVAMLTDLDTLAEINAIIADGTLIDTSDARLSDARTPLGHGHAAGDLNSGEVSVIRGGTGSGTASGARTNLGLAIGSAIQAFDAGLLSIAGLATAADKMIYTTGSDAYAVAALSAYARTLLDDDDAAAARATLLLATMSQAEAETGTETTTRAITAQRMKQAIDALAGGGLKMINSQVASNSSSLDFTSAHVTDTYDTHLIVGEGLVVATDATDMHFLISNDGGSTFEQDASEYRYVAKGRHSGGSDINHQQAGATQIVLNINSLSNVAAEGFSFAIYMSGAARAAAFTTFGGKVWYHDNSSRVVAEAMTAAHKTAEVVNGLSVTPAAGNIVTGRLTLYGLKHA